MHDRLYALRGAVDRPAVELIARELGLDLARFRADLDAHTFAPLIAADLADARKLGVAGTPMFFINGKPVFGAQSLRVFTDAVDDALVRAAAPRSSIRPDLYAAMIAGGKPTADAPANTGPAASRSTSSTSIASASSCPAISSAAATRP